MFKEKIRRIHMEKIWGETEAGTKVKIVTNW